MLTIGFDYLSNLGSILDFIWFIYFGIFHVGIESLIRVIIYEGVMSNFYDFLYVFQCYLIFLYISFT